MRSHRRSTHLRLPPEGRVHVRHRRPAARQRAFPGATN